MKIILKIKIHQIQLKKMILNKKMKFMVQIEDIKKESKKKRLKIQKVKKSLNKMIIYILKELIQII